MTTHLCGSSGPFDFSNACIRASWSALLPSALVVALCVFTLRVPLPSLFCNFSTRVKAPLHAFLTLNEAEALNVAAPGAGPLLDDDERLAIDGAFPLRRNNLLTFIALVQVLSYVASGMHSLLSGNDDTWIGITAVVVGLTWVYGVWKPAFWPKATVHFDLFALYIIHLLLALLQVGGTIYDHEVLHVPTPPCLQVSQMAVNLVAVMAALAIVVTMPFEVPSVCIQKSLYSPEDYTTMVEWLTFSWVYPLIKRGINTAMDEEDVWDLSPTMQSRPVFAKFSTIARPTLLRSLFVASSLDLFVMFNYASPYFLRRILESIENPSPESRSQAYIYAFLAFFCALVKAVTDAQHLWYGRRAATRLRVVFMAAIYDKALKRRDYSGVVDRTKAKEATGEKNGFLASGTRNSDDPKAGADVGKIVNLMAVDANKVSRMVSGAHLIYGSPLEIIIASTFLYNLLGLSAFAGFVVLLAGWPLNSYVARRNIRIQKGVSASRDKRMAVVNELISAVRFIKFFAWEECWIGRAMDARNVELKWITKARINSVIFSAIWITAPIMVSLISFFTYVYQGNTLSVSTAFTAISLFAMIRFPLNVVPSWIVQVLQAGVALKRIETFLNEGEVTEQVSSIKRLVNSMGALREHEGLAIENGSFRWNLVSENKSEYPTPVQCCKSGSVSPGDDVGVLDDRTFGLRDISVRFPEGKLSLITGPTASGKTALLLALLGEMTITGGKLVMSKDTFKVDKDGNTNSISYVAQSPWLRQQSIKDNILFGCPYDESRYNAVIEWCALLPDLTILEDGDETEIGVRQRLPTRVALARAVYARTKYVLLDDPLSALDSHTARFLCDNLLTGPLFANRTVVLVTHHVDLVLPGAHYLVRMLDGRIDTQGTVDDLRVRGVLDRILPDSSTIIDKRAAPVKLPVSSAEAVVAPDTVLGGQSKAFTKKPRRLIAEEHRERGGVKWLTYNAYLKASSYWTWVTLIFLVMCSQSLGVADKLWIREWAQSYGSRPAMSLYVSVTNTFTGDGALIPTGFIPSHDVHGYSILHQSSLLPDANEHPLLYVAVWGIIGLVFIVVSVLSASVQYSGALRASRSLFHRLLQNVVHATIRWHDITPQGRILNRFGKDIETIDSNIGGSLAAVNSSLAAFAGAILTIAIFFPLFLLPAVVIGFFYYRLAICYLRTGRDLRRMESNSRSPIFSGFAELLEGIVTVRAFSAERRFMDDLYHKIDTTTKMWYNFWMTNRWLLLNFDALGSLAILTTTLFALSGYVGAGAAGLCITSAMTFTNSVYWACRVWTTLELDLNSVERVVEYFGIPQEPPSVIESNRPPAYWPSSTSSRPLVSVENLVLKYSEELPPVIHNVSFTLNARERVGLIGRTGSGKSTLAMSFLRFVEPAAGRIMIDGIDISQIGIRDVRSHVTFIPQDATLFSGTLRENLDPFGDHEDSECLDVLYRVQMLSEYAYHSQRSLTMSTTFPTADDGTSSGPSSATTEIVSSSRFSITLGTQVSAGGSNFSQGQRQLVALARALLRRSQVVILDEATSSIDFETEAKIQVTIREEFKDSLLLTVAHRLRTVIDYDRLIVLDKGKVVEFDTPLNLIRTENSIFRNMCVQSGMFTELEAAAQAH
ncbi:P-loop containing nucleoside triphosphate hydrolase protein [Paxillus ammoniavirescens]|nr:P-loop containing nucleoside triphosphate hydrolase protein [Paxillus ammoniavirescens]